MKGKVELLLGISLLLFVVAIVTTIEPVSVSVSDVEVDYRYRVVVDAGHGGRDPGKVGENNILEKDINLSIAKKLGRYLEMKDVQVILTRDSDRGLYRATDRNKKMADMRERIRIIEEASPNLVVSIHQNSFHQERVRGAQVFYYERSAPGQYLAGIVQERLSQVTGIEKTERANSDYYLLLHSSAPSIIIESGFLSNRSEAALLAQDDYQEKLAWSISMAIMEYLSTSMDMF